MNFFFIDVETTGCRGVPIWAKENQIIQICCYHQPSDSWFKQLCNPGDDLYLPPENIESHRITRNDLLNSSKTEDVVEELKNWIKDKSTTQPILIAHNALFDRSMIYKSFKNGIGPNGKKLKWKWYCTMLAFKKFYAELDNIYFPVERPYSMGTLMEHFFPSFDMGKAHNAETDVLAMKDLFNKHLIHKEDWTKIDKIDNILEYSASEGPKQTSKLTLVKNVRGFGTFRTRKLNEKVNTAFLNAENKWSEYVTPIGLFTCAHLIVYAMLRFDQKNKLQQQGLQDLDIWFFVCKEIEHLCRVELGITSDSTICELLTHVTSRSQIDLCLHTMHNTGEKTFFPTMAGHHIAFRPFDFNKDEAMNITKELGMKTATEIYVKYLYTPDNQKNQFRLRLQAQLRKGNTLTEHKLNKIFNDLNKYV